jgi:hypothetical protein
LAAADVDLDLDSLGLQADDGAAHDLGKHQGKRVSPAKMAAIAADRLRTATPL